MREEAVIHDAIVLLNNIIIHQPKIPASQILLSHYRSNRYIGAGDRQAIGDLVHGVLRHYYALEADQIGDTEEIVARYLLIKMELNTKDISTIFSGRGYGPKSLSSLQLNQLQEWHEEEKKGYPKKSWRLLNCPKWLYEPILAWWGKEKGQALLAKLNEPSLPVLRINTQKATLKNTLAHLNKIGITATTGILSPWAIRLNGHQILQNHPLIQNGVIEIQDEGSQIMGVLDYCAGACGKTLALGMIMSNKGSITATDIHDFRLERGRVRLRRASLYNATTKVLDKDGMKWLKRQHETFDRVLVDAPCSGTGTWHRHLEQRLRFQPQTLEDLIQTQRQILSQVYKTVAIGGNLIYGTCSILPCENTEQIAWFLKSFPQFVAVDVKQILSDFLTPSALNILKNGMIFTQNTSNEPKTLNDCDPSPYLHLNPVDHGCDGFFVAVLKRIA